VIRVVIVDDHAIVRRGIRQIVAESATIEVVGEASDYGELMTLLRERECDVVLLDIAMPGKNGIEILKAVRERHAKVRVLMFSTYPEDQYAVRALKAGASGYLNKSSAPEKLVEAIQQIGLGRRYITPEFAESLAASVAEPETRDPHELLSDREFQTLRLIASGRKLSEIAEELAISPKTVSVYRARVLEKMKLRTNTELTRYAVTHSLVE